MSTIPRLRKQGNATQLLVHDKPFIILGGELHNSSASSLEFMEPIFDKLAAMNLNTVLAPLYWELVEPTESRHDFALVEGLIAGARRRGLRLVFLWFGTLKNAISCYAPEWVKTDLTRFPRAECKPGESSDTVSTFCEEAAACDARAFAAVMRRIREIDERENTVLMMQVENEPGILGASRDHCPLAETAFAQPVPEELMRSLVARRDSLIPEFAMLWRETGFRETGTWSEVFGRGADEVFMAWRVARFIERVTAAGKSEYDLPMYANAWLVQDSGDKPGQYPSGGPVSRMLDVWRAAAPHIDLLAPDIYAPGFVGHCASYARSGNPLFIPEARNDPAAAARVLYALGRHDAVGFSPFAIDDLDSTHPLVETYQLLREMAPMLTDAHGAGRMTAFLQQADQEQWSAELGDFRFIVRTRKTLAEAAIPGGALLLAVSDCEFVVVGRNLVFTFEPRSSELRQAEFLWLDEGWFADGQWRAQRRLNGDESAHGMGVGLDDTLRARRFKLHGYR